MTHPLTRFRSPRMGLLALLASLTSLWAATALAHKPSDSHLTLTPQNGGVVDVQWHVALRDLDDELTLDTNDDGRLSWGEVRSRWAEVSAWVRPHLRLSHAGQACVAMPAQADDPPPALAQHTDGRYAVLRWRHQCPIGGTDFNELSVDYRLFATTDPTHRGIVRWPSGVVVLGTNRPTHRMALSGLQGAMAASAASASASMPALASATNADAVDVDSDVADEAASPPKPESALDELLRFIVDGVHHIAIGTDHILFLLSLLLVSVWRREGPVRWWPPTAGWQPRETARASWAEVLKLVTSFTLAHSVTLGLATFGVLSPPSRWVESVIALSVLLAALDNLLPLLRAPRWAVVFGFGLIHGFGFAGVLQDLGLEPGNIALPLLGFNLGVELGQLALVAVVLPLALLMRRSAFYRHAVVVPLSIGIALLSAVWLVERAADVTLLGVGG